MARSTVGLHDLSRPWRYWIWHGEVVEVPAGSTHEEIAERIIADPPWGRTAQGWMLQEGAIKQWDLHFVSGSKQRDALLAMQRQLESMVSEEGLTGDRAVLIAFGDFYESTTVSEVLSARSFNDLIFQRGDMHPNSEWNRYVRGEYWFYEGELTPADSVDGVGHEEVAMNYLVNIDDAVLAMQKWLGDLPDWVTEETDVAEIEARDPFRRLSEQEHEAAWREIMGDWYEDWSLSKQPFTDELLRQGGVRLLNGYVNVWDETPQSLGSVQDALFELLAGDDTSSETLTIEATGTGHVYRDVPLDDVLTAKGWGELRRAFLANISYLDAVKRSMAESYGAATTNSPFEFGFLLEDGSWLKMGHDGSRGDDHRVVVGYVRGKTRREAETGSRWAALVHWMQVTKSIRWMPESCMFELWTKPTRAQLSAMREMGRDCELEGVTVEVNNRGKVYERTFERRELASMELWIDRAWRGVLHGDEKR